MTEKISQKTARRLLLYAQLLDGRAKTAPGKKGVAETVGHLGYVQIDTISVIERAHHHTLWTRLPDYQPEHLHQALAVERSVFEYWGHAASYLPMKDFRFYLPMMKSFYDPKNAWFRGWGEKFGAFLGPVLERIRADGPLVARDFENPGKKKSGPWWDSTNHPPVQADPIGLPQLERSSWWDWKPAKAALEMLFWRGELMVRERRGFERVYDLSERVLPEGTDRRMPGNDELGRFIVGRALGALGIASGKEIRDYIRIGDKSIITTAIKEMLACAEILPVAVEGANGAFYSLTDVLAKAGGLPAGPSCVRLLSPFDNLVINRSRMSERFDFSYTLECYVPKEKRRQGYFVLPILFGEDFIGQLDPKADRKTRTLLLRQLTIDPRFVDAERLIPELGRTFWALARFNGCRTIVLESVRPAKIAAPLRRALGPMA